MKTVGEDGNKSTFSVTWFISAGWSFKKHLFAIQTFNRVFMIQVVLHMSNIHAKENTSYFLTGPLQVLKIKLKSGFLFN